MHAGPRDASQPLDSERIPWIPLGPGESFKPLRFLPDERGRALLLRLEPGTVVPRHRHLGEVHCYNVAGHRKLLDTGEVVGPGGYVYEPAGNVDSWMAVGTAPVIVHILSAGAMEYLGENGEVLRRDTASSLRDIYLRHCEGNGLAPLDLGHGTVEIGDIARTKLVDPVGRAREVRFAPSGRIDHRLERDRWQSLQCDDGSVHVTSLLQNPSRGAPTATRTRRRTRAPRGGAHA